MNARSRALSFALTTILLAAGSPLLAGDTQWQKNHPRREQVNGRLANQNKRIDQGVRNGTLTPQEAKQLHREDGQIRQEERDMASQNGGHITKLDQKTLNQQENQVSKQIYEEKHGKCRPPPQPRAASTTSGEHREQQRAPAL